LVVDLVKHTVG
jgi:hypothetical protein